MDRAGKLKMSHRSTGLISAKPVNSAPMIDWGNKIKSAEEWLKDQPTESWKDFFAQNGYLVVKDLITCEEVSIYGEIYDKLLSGEIDTRKHRHDLGNHEDRKTKTENICQIMWPSIYVDGLSEEGPIHKRAMAVSKMILGDDMEFDFDMLIAKCALDNATVDNGCMWFVPGSHLQSLRSHRPVRPGVHVLTCDGAEEEGTPQPINAGSATFHHGKTIHYTRGNSTDTQRRAFITNFRPKAMVEQERQMRFDHGKDAGTESIKGTGQTHELNK